MIKYLLLIFLAVVLSACGSGGQPFSTHTPSPSATPTCSPAWLSTPEGWGNSSTLFVILYDPQGTQGEDLELEYLDGSTPSVEEFAFRIAQDVLLEPGVEISIFQLGHRTYEAARRARFHSPLERPTLYETPSPYDTVTPYPTSTFVPQGLEVPKATTDAAKTATAHAVIATATSHAFACRMEEVDGLIKFTATAWAATEAVESTRAVATLNPEFSASAEPTSTPYLPDVVYDGLGHATIDFIAGCSQYERCVLLIIDDLRTWGLDNPNNLTIDLTGVEVFTLMPDCRDINQPSCVQLQEYWTREFERYGATGVEYINGERAEFNLREFLRR